MSSSSLNVKFLLFAQIYNISVIHLLYYNQSNVTDDNQILHTCIIKIKPLNNSIPGKTKLTLLPTHLAGVSQEALGVRDQLRVPSVCVGGEAGQLSASRESQRLRGGLRGELWSWQRVLRSEEMLLQRLRPHLPGSQRPIQGYAEPQDWIQHKPLYLAWQWSRGTQSQTLFISIADWLRFGRSLELTPAGGVRASLGDDQ